MDLSDMQISFNYIFSLAAFLSLRQRKELATLLHLTNQSMRKELHLETQRIQIFHPQPLCALAPWREIIFSGLFPRC